MHLHPDEAKGVEEQRRKQKVYHDQHAKGRQAHVSDPVYNNKYILLLLFDQFQQWAMLVAWGGCKQIRTVQNKICYNWLSFDISFAFLAEVLANI